MRTLSVTQALVWKEVREMWVWAAGAGILFGAELAYIFGIATGRLPGVDVLVVIALMVGIVALFTPALCGVALGFQQFHWGGRRDSWAFLVHRPVSRWQIFWIKAGVGAVLYLVALGLPFAGLAWWIGGVSRPADWEHPMMFVAADILVGLAYYFAGAVMALRKARWFGSRLLVLGPAVVMSIIVVATTHAFDFSPQRQAESLWPWLAVGTASGFGALAAWGLYVTGGSFARMPWVAKFGLGTSIVISILALGGLAVAASIAIVGLPEEHRGDFLVRSEEPEMNWTVSYWALVPPAAVPLDLGFEAGGMYPLGKPVLPAGFELASWFVLSRVELMGMGVLAAVVMNIWASRRYGYSARGRVVWIVLALTLGMAGVVLFWCLPELPARVKCAKCGRKRVVTRETCGHCGAGWARPEMKGTEVFEGV